MLKSFYSMIVLMAFTASAAAAQSTYLVKMSDSQLDEVVGGAGCYTRTKGNNGWGNGADPINPGSAHGRTAPSKLANGSAGSRPNSNPTRSNGR